VTPKILGQELKYSQQKINSKNTNKTGYIVCREARTKQYRNRFYSMYQNDAEAEEVLTKDRKTVKSEQSWIAYTIKYREGNNMEGI
jgi:hypothetical protein